MGSGSVSVSCPYVHSRGGVQKEGGDQTGSWAVLAVNEHEMSTTTIRNTHGWRVDKVVVLRKKMGCDWRVIASFANIADACKRVHQEV